MLKTLKDLFEGLRAPALAAPPQAREHALQLAAAVLLVEVMRADADVHSDERDAVLAALTERFALAPDERDRLVELAHASAAAAVDFYAFTTQLNEHWPMEDRIGIVEQMWRVAYADGRLSAHEKHVIWRIADLLYVPHAASMHAKVRARTAAGADGLGA